MIEKYSQNKGYLIILHGGSAAVDRQLKGIEPASIALKNIASAAMQMCNKGEDIKEIATYCTSELEDDPIFNAGQGSALQSDGLARLTAAMMDGKAQRFSGVISVGYVRNPSKMAEALQMRQSRVITAPGADLLARELKLPVCSNVTQARRQQWVKASQEKNKHSNGTDTVGCLIRASSGRLVVCASTGGKGKESPGRVSDTATVAGTYASKYAAVAATGDGEQIVDDAVAARIETRIRDGQSLQQACKKTFLEAKQAQRHYGWIAVDRHGNWGVYSIADYMPFIVFGEQGCIASSLM